MIDNDDKKLEEIIAQMDKTALCCKKHYRCTSKKCFEICKAAEFSKTHLMCLEENPMKCEFASCLGGKQFVCFCPARMYIYKKYKK